MPETEVATDRLTYSLEAIDEAAKSLLHVGRNQNVWTLRGAMGSGKTTLVKALVKQLNRYAVASSPTFSIVNEYSGESNKPIFHFDFYRIKDEREAFDIGTDEYFDSGNLCLVEWPEKIPSLLPHDRFEIDIETINDSTRTIHYSNHG